MSNWAIHSKLSNKLSTNNKKSCRFCRMKSLHAIFRFQMIASFIPVMSFNFDDKNKQDIVLYVIDDAILRGDSTRPSDIIAASQRFRMAYACSRVFAKFR